MLVWGSQVHLMDLQKAKKAPKWAMSGFILLNPLKSKLFKARWHGIDEY
jgi:hypothetical protein